MYLLLPFSSFAYEAEPYMRKNLAALSYAWNEGPKLGYWNLPINIFLIAYSPLNFLLILKNKNCIGIPYKFYYSLLWETYLDDRYYIFSFPFLHPDPVVSSKSKQNQCETLFVIQPSYRLAIKSIDIHRTILSDPSFLEILFLMFLKCVIGTTIAGFFWAPSVRFWEAPGLRWAEFLCKIFDLSFLGENLVFFML